uniref:PPM-type phosphatase domain-containing protein n=1 Tax=Caenorhabditis tropicalis TaxID=1561998 RepID=A0A1I7U9X1_9PELO
MESRKRSAEESNESSEASKKSKETRILHNTLAAYGSRQGERADMQDTHILVPKFYLGDDTSFLYRSSFFAIFDGHAGPRASEYCQNQMVLDFASLTKSLKQTFTESYKAVDDVFLVLAKQNKPIWKDGTTATTMVILNNVIYVANIGDSKAVVARKKEDGSFAPVCLTADHNPMAHDERMRIQKTGAVVKDGRINGVIEVSRSIGDLPFKSSGIVSTPDLKKLTLTENDL